MVSFAVVIAGDFLRLISPFTRSGTAIFHKVLAHYCQAFCQIAVRALASAEPRRERKCRRRPWQGGERGKLDALNANAPRFQVPAD